MLGVPYVNIIDLGTASKVKCFFAGYDFAKPKRFVYDKIL